MIQLNGKLTKKQRKRLWELVLEDLTEKYRTIDDLHIYGICHSIEDVAYIQNVSQALLVEELTAYFKPVTTVFRAYYWTTRNAHRGLKSEVYKVRATAIGFLIALNS